jgi:hypothetical protein
MRTANKSVEPTATRSRLGSVPVLARFDPLLGCATAGWVAVAHLCRSADAFPY